MRLKILYSLLAVALISAVCVYGLSLFGITQGDEENLQAEAADNTERTVVLDSAKGAAASDIISEISELDRGTIKLSGKFTVNETIVLHSGITLDAQDAAINGNADIVISAYNANDVHIKGGSWKLGDSSRLMKISSCSGCSLDGLTVNGGGSFDYGNIILYSTYQVSIENCIFTNTRSQVVFAHQSDSFSIYNCTFSSCNGYAVYVYSSADPVVVNNRANGICGDGIKLVKCSGSKVSGNTVSDVTFNPRLDIDPVRNTARSGCGILLSECKDTFLGTPCTYGSRSCSGNAVSGCENYGIHITMCKNTLLADTSFTDIGTDGVHNSASAETFVKSCSFKGCGEKAVFFVPGPIEELDEELRLCKDSSVESCKIEDCGTFGIMLSIADNIRLIENDIKDCEDYGIFCNSCKNIYISNGSVSGTKEREGLGISYSDDCEGIDIDMSFTLSKDELIMGKGEKFLLHASLPDLRWKTDNSSVAAVNDGEITANSTGAAKISAVTSGGKSVSCKVTVKEPAKSIDISLPSLTLGVGEQYRLTASIPPDTATARKLFRSSNSGIIKMTETDGEGVFTAVNKGTAWVTAATAGGKESSCRITVVSSPAKVSLNHTALTLGIGETAKLSAVLPEGTASAKRTFRTSNSSIIKMTKTNWQGEFKAVGVGTAWVTVRLYNGIEASCKITVKAEPSSVSLSQSTLTLGKGESFRLWAMLPEGTASGTKSFTSSNSSVASAASDGTVKAKKPGTAWISVKLYNGYTASCKVTVRNAPSSVWLSSNTLSMKVGQSAKLTSAIPSGTAAMTRIYRTSNSSVIKMTKTHWKGEFTAAGKGTAWVTVRLYNGIEKSCKITVK